MGGGFIDRAELPCPIEVVTISYYEFAVSGGYRFRCDGIAPQSGAGAVRADSDAHLRQGPHTTRHEANLMNSVTAGRQCIWLVMGCLETVRSLQVASAFGGAQRVTWMGWQRI